MQGRATLLVAMVAAALAGGCSGGGDDEPRRERAGKAAEAATPAASGAAKGTVTIYSSLPLSGDAEPSGRDIQRGARVALEKAEGRAGAFRVRLRSLEGSSAEEGTWTPELVVANAQRATGDDSTVGYIGEWNSGATAISLPLLNRAGIAQVSPSGTAIHVTRSGPGTASDEPERYYPTGKRTFFRMIPADHLQAAALATLAEELGAKRVGVVRDGTPYGKSLGGLAASAVRRRGLRSVSRATLRRGGGNARAIAAKLRRAGAQSLILAGIDGPGGAKLFGAVRRAIPGATLLGSDGLVTDELAGALGSGAEAFTHLTSPILAAEAYPDAAQPLLMEIERRSRTDVSPWALYGYESMTILLEAIRRAGDRGDDRAAVVDQLRRIENRDSVLGRYSIDESGDTTLPTYGVFAVNGGELEYERTIDSSRP